MLKPHIPRAARGAALTLAITAVGCSLSATASAETTIGAFKGVPTPAGLSTSSVYSYDDTDGVSTRTAVIRDGAAVDQKAPTFELVSGDVIQAINSTTNAIIAWVPFEEAPALTAGTCVGSAALQGLRNPAASVDYVYAYKRGAMVSDGEGGQYSPTEDVIRGSVLMTAGNRFAGAFRKVIPEGHILRASQSILLSETASYDVTVEREVTACPPAPAAAPAADVTGPSGQLILPKFLRESQLRRNGMAVKTDISEAGIVRVDVYADDAAATEPNPEFVRLAGGKKTTATAGRVTIKLKATRLGRQAMKGHHRIKAMVVSTITDTSGNVARLKTKKITIR